MHAYTVADPEGGPATPPPPFFLSTFVFIPFCIRMLKNIKAQTAQESIKKD